MDSFFMTDARRLAKDAPSMRLHDLIDWAEIAHKLKGRYKRELTRGGGPQPYEVGLAKSTSPKAAAIRPPQTPPATT